MSNSTDAEGLSRKQLLQINQICNDFESAWNDGTPSIREYVADVSPELRTALLHYLIELDIECREANHCLLTPEDYTRRFSGISSDWVASRFSSVGQSLKIADSVCVEVDDTGLDLTTEELLARLRSSRVLSDDDLSHSMASVDTSNASVGDIGRALVDARFLTEFQLESICRRPVDPLVLGEYVLLEQIGEGGMGTVYRAMHRRMKRVVALKVLKTDVAHAEELALRFIREVQVAAQLSHPNIVTAYDAGEQHGLSYLVCEFIDGQNLAEIIKEHGPLSLPDALNVTTQMAEGLAYAHGKGVIHRDIKPSNLLLDDEGNAKLLDVGLAKLNRPESDSEETSDLTKTGLIMGTVDYMAPEQAQNTRLADERSDIYSVGCTFHFLVTGRAPYTGGSSIERLFAHRDNPTPDLLELNSCVPDQLQSLLERCLAKDPRDRFQTADELTTYLQSISTDEIPDLTLPVAEPASVDATVAESWTAPDDNATRQIEQSGFAAITENSNDALATVVASDFTAAISGDSNQKQKSWWPGIVAVVALVSVIVWAMLPDSDRQSETPAAPEGLPQVRALHELNENEAIRYRDSWQTAADSPFELPCVEFVVIPPGEFTTDLETLRVPGPILMSSTEITVGAFRAFAETTGFQSQSDKTGGYGFDRANRQWILRPDYGWRNLGDISVTDRMPAAGISYEDAMAYCNWATKTTGQVVRLPTEVEWEYASRAGRPGRWCCGESDESLGDFAWMRFNSGQELNEVATCQPNFWGLYDMHGSECEWCVAEPDAGTAPLRGGSYSSTSLECTHNWRKQQRKSQIIHGAFRVVVELR